MLLGSSPAQHAPAKAGGGDPCPPPRRRGNTARVHSCAKGGYRFPPPACAGACFAGMTRPEHTHPGDSFTSGRREGASLMPVKFVSFFAIILTALALVAGRAQLLALPKKSGLAQDP